jgi:DNA repair protein RadD
MTNTLSAHGAQPITLRDYQDEFVNAIRAEYRKKHKAVLLVAATGAGKTVVFSHIARGASSKGKRILILAHWDQLIKQASQKLMQNSVPHGIIMAGFTPSPRRNVQVASVQTLVRRIEHLKTSAHTSGIRAHSAALAAGHAEEVAAVERHKAEQAAGFDMIVIDEAHLSAAKSYADILAAWPDALVLGVTGSPARLDGRGLGRKAGGAFDVMVQGISIRELIEQGYLVKPKVYAAKVKVDFSNVKMVGGEYDSNSMAEVMDKPVITGHAVTEYKRICPGVPAVAWCTNVAHARHVAEQFNAAGVPALALSGENTSAERDAALKALTNGQIKVITFAMLLVEGVDCPAIGAVIMLRLTMSLSSYLQTVGRGLRTIYAPGLPVDTVEQRFAAIDAGPKGRHCYIIDHCDLWKRHGFADSDREWSLEGVKKKSKKKDDEPTIDATQCPKCWIVFDPKSQPGGKENVCPGCGHIILPRVVTGPDHVDGSLVEITPEMEALIKKKNKADVSGAKTLADFEKIAAQRGYSIGWALHAFNARARARERYRAPSHP